MALLNSLINFRRHRRLLDRQTTRGGSRQSFRPRLEPLEARQLLTASTIAITSADLHATEGRFFNAQVATFTDSNGDANPSHFTAAIHWGDGGTSSGTVVPDPAHHQFKVFGQHVFKEEGTAQITVSVTDKQGTSAVDAFFQQSNLVSDVPGLAAHTDPNLVNPWGLVPNPTGFWWVNDNATGLSTLYSGTGVVQSLVVRIPGPNGSPPGTLGKPTGIVFNSTTDFQVTGGKSFFIFATEDGTISAWIPAILNDAQLKVDNSPQGAIYKGLATGTSGGANFIYATDFHNGKIDVFDGQFQPVALAGNFTDPHLPAGYAPFGIQNIGGKLFVSYAQQDADRHDNLSGAGLGFLDVFSTDGHLLTRFESHGPLNAPWGIVQAPANFGPFSNDLLVGNFGDGKINAFDPTTHAWLGPLQDATGAAITIDGLWGLSFGNGGNAGPVNELFFTSGPNEESHGLFGGLAAAGHAGTATIADANLVAFGITTVALRNHEFSGTVGAFLDLNPFGRASDFTVSVDWGDGTPSSNGKVVSLGAGLFAIAGTHTYASGGSHDVTISVLDDGGSAVTIHSRVLVFGV
jgi:uncharacterized protein (TIGR03118 family)